MQDSNTHCYNSRHSSSWKQTTATIQDRTNKPTVFVLHNHLQEASKRFLVSSEGSLTYTRVFDHQPRSLTSTRVFDHQPKFLNSQKDLKQLPSSMFINFSWFPLPFPDLYEVVPSPITTRSRTLLNLVSLSKRLPLRAVSLTVLSSAEG